MKALFFAAVALIPVVAHASGWSEYTNTGAPVNVIQFNRDSRECMDNSETAVSRQPKIFSQEETGLFNDLIIRCMTTKGYVIVYSHSNPN
jgi:hypothetical protein